MTDATGIYFDADLGWSDLRNWSVNDFEFAPRFRYLDYTHGITTHLYTEFSSLLYRICSDATFQQLKKCTRRVLRLNDCAVLRGRILEVEFRFRGVTGLFALLGPFDNVRDDGPVDVGDVWIVHLHKISGGVVDVELDRSVG